MPLRDQLLHELQGENDYGVLLVAQMGGIAQRIAVDPRNRAYDEAAQRTAPAARLLIRVLGVREHRVNLGVFGRLAFTDDHPLLYHHNTPRVAVHFDGKPQDVHELVLDISQAYVSTFGQWRHLVDMADDINRTLPMVDLLSSGYGLLGTMPKPLAERMAKVLAHHNIGCTPDRRRDLRHRRRARALTDGKAPSRSISPTSSRSISPSN